MKTPENPKQEDIEDARRLAGGGASLEMILMFFRERGFDKIDSINVVRAMFGKSMADAKEIVDHSDAWSDRFRSDMEFRETAWKALRDIAASQDPSLPKIVIEGDTKHPGSK
jgi:ribosomal protein L7/L12